MSCTSFANFCILTPAILAIHSKYVSITVATDSKSGNRSLTKTMPAIK